MRVKFNTPYRSLVLSDTFRHVVQTAIMLEWKECYSENDVKTSAGRILGDGWTVCKVSKEYKLLSPTLLRKGSWFHSQPRQDEFCKGNSFNLTAEDETKIVTYTAGCTPVVSAGVQVTGSVASHYKKMDGGREINLSVMCPSMWLSVAKNPAEEREYSQTKILNIRLFMSGWILYWNIWRV